MKQLLPRLVVFCGLCFLFLVLADPRSRACICKPMTKPDCNTDCINALNYCAQHPTGFVANAYFSEHCATPDFQNANSCDQQFCNYCQQVAGSGCGGGD